MARSNRRIVLSNATTPVSNASTPPMSSDLFSVAGLTLFFMLRFMFSVPFLTFSGVRL